MQMNAPGKRSPGRKSLLYLLLLFISSATYSQSISLSLKNASLEKAFMRIEAQSPYRFSYASEALEGTHPITLELKNQSIETVLKAIFWDQPIAWSIDQKFILVRPKEKEQQGTPPLSTFALTGLVLNEKGEGIAGASVTELKSGKATATNLSGRFNMEGIDPRGLLEVSSIGYHTQKISLEGNRQIQVQLSISVSSLDETVVIAYGTTTNRLNTGSVSKVSGEEISKQPVSNPLAALQGRVPGMVITQSTGLPGGAFKVQIRGRTALDLNLTDDEPLFVIDGVPFAPNNGYLNTLRSALGVPSKSPGITMAGGLSPLNSINASDIESIEVLKDADATAIYGSRGANGVILITTKKGKAGGTVFNFNINTGFSRVSKKMDMLNTPQYLLMRREAFRNDGATPSPANAFDFMVWDTTRYTDFQKLLIGGTARTSDIQTSVTGGTAYTRFLIGGSYHQESTVFPGNMNDKRGSLQFNLTYTLPNEKFKILLSGNYTAGKNNLTVTDLTTYIFSPPNLAVYDSAGNLAWNEGNLANNYENPLAFLQQKYAAQTGNLLGQLQLNFTPTRDLDFRVNAGYNTVMLHESQTFPLAAQNPMHSPVRSASFASNLFKTWIMEPQVQYRKSLFGGKIDLLTGTTWQNSSNDIYSVSGSGYSSDALLNSLSGATSITGQKQYTHYRYAAVFGRIHYNWKNKYLLNLSARRDGSSRFGPGKQFANFGAIGAAWIFSSENFFLKKLPFVSFGKLRASYGLTGNDKISNYQYLDTWEPAQNPYLNEPALTPTKLFNPNYHWEKTTKFEGALDLGFLHDRFSISLAYYRNQSSNQLVQYKLPATTGFTTVIQNLPAVVENRGLEMALTSTNLKSNTVTWSTSLNITFPKTTLVSFPGLGLSSYASQYVEGQPLNLVYGYKYLGVDPTTGLYTVEDVNKDGTYDVLDYQVQGSLDPACYGGLKNSLQYKDFSFDLFFQFTKQTGRNWLGNAVYPAGMPFNMPAEVMQRWQQEGNRVAVQKFTQVNNSSGPAYDAFSNLLSRSNGIYGDASFIRLKNISLSYSLSNAWTKKVGLSSFKFYVLGQNLLTFTGYTGGDPETQNYLRMPPLKTIVAGIQLMF
jgi:TonB-linked SusC/RagA family outer membrane protein